MTFSPVAALRVNITPEPESSPMLPKTIALHVDGGADRVRDLFFVAVDDGALVVPRTEHGGDGGFELLVGVGGEFAAGLLFEELLVDFAERFPIVAGQFGVFGFAEFFFVLGEDALEAFFAKGRDNRL